MGGRTLLLGGAALVTLTVMSGSALTDCSISGTTATCTGDPGAIFYTDGSVDTIEINDLSADVSGDTAVELTQTGSEGSSHGDDGKDGVDLDINATTDSQNITGTTSGVIVESTGGKGHSGKDKNVVVGDEKGGSGGDGGDGGMVTIAISGSSTTVSGGKTAITGISQAGNGGSGGEGSSEAGEGKGGEGGDGGDGGTVTATLSVVTSVSDGTSGILLQSVGGNGKEGGEGGGEEGKGGHGGSGGSGGAVTLTAVDDSVDIATSSDAGHGVETSSFAGKGGKGGKGAGIYGEGGTGGGGGTGGTAKASVKGSISTDGTEAVGLLVRSYGGDGGDGGEGEGFTGNGGASNSPGPGGDATLTFQGSITTTGSEGLGILVQSVGGFAGDAGASGGLVAWGANDESGGDAGDVKLTLGDNSDVTVTTTGDYATGVEMHSVGGGGGVGTTSGGAVSVLGGAGSAGGDAGQVTFSVDHSQSGYAKIATSGTKAHGVLGLSSGGGGGSSGSGGGIVSLGGKGGTGGDGGYVQAYLGDLRVETTGDAADAIHFASVGAGGGNARSLVGITAFGASGGDGGDGGAVSVTGLEGYVSTKGDDADGILVQSSGGGGGKGTSVLAMGAEFSIAHGGKGGDGGSSASVTYTDADSATAYYTTTGDRARGVVVQSSGGGGGSAGYAIDYSAGAYFDTAIGMTGDGGKGVDGGTVTVKVHGDITTGGTSATGLLAQSVGGGGGSVGTTLTMSVTGQKILEASVAIGGNGGTAGAGKGVMVEAYGDITTIDDESTALLAQSSGGGGGHSSSTWSTSISAASDGLNLSDDVAIDGSGGAGGDSGDVTVTTTGAIKTSGSNSDGIHAQSTAGGGGKAGKTGVFDVSLGSYDANVAVGGAGGAGGNAGQVTITSSSDVTTTGAAASGIIGQSTGGSGGDGSTVISGDALSTGSINVSVSGSGADASNADAVTIISSGTISTTGDKAEGILAQSHGGGGGSAGGIVSATAWETASIGVEVGGSSGDGGKGGTATLIVSGSVSTTGVKAPALTAQSLGGGGGSAGSVISVEALTTQETTVSVGGSGGNAGKSEEVTVNNLAGLSTSGDYSYGILAQSLAGAGGSGATHINVGVSKVTSSANSNTITVGAGGGDGGTSSTVDVTSAGVITTAGYGAHGILAQSSGGDGGVGGSVVAVDVTATTSGSAGDLDVDVGGSGGDGGSAGDVGVTNTGTIFTSGDLADGIRAKSTGGGGGDGGSSTSYIFSASKSPTSASTVNIAVDVGGEGGDGGSKAGDVSVLNSGNVSATGGSSNGIKAMSVGGIGGDGGSAVNAIATFSVGSTSSYTGSARITVGGTGGTGHVAGATSVENSGIIVTTEDTSSGIYASSHGGGGGDGGNASAISYGTSVSASNTGSLGLSVATTIGGSGGTGGHGDTVTVKNEGIIQTSGVTSYGIFAQSMGGGGGTGGNGAFGIKGMGSTASEISSYLQDANELYSDYQSLKSLYTNVSVDIGGSGGAAGDAGDVSVTNSGIIYTQGDSATAIYAQANGGGGGVGGDGGGGLITSIDVAGFGSGGGDGGTVDITNEGSIYTEGEGAMGIFAQSVGGGGGSGGDLEGSLAADLVDLTIGLATVLGADVEGEGGDGGDIVIDKTGDITTTGNYAHGVWAHSVGGGGGAAAIIGFTSITFGGVGSSSDDGDAGRVEIGVDGDILVSGDYATGVFAQSASGNGDSDEGKKVTIDVTGNITASGTGSRAILAQSSGNVRNGTLAITVESGSTLQGSDDGYETIGLLGGSANTISNSGSILAPVDSDSVYAIHSEAGSGSSVAVDPTTGVLTITNSGIITGSIALNASATNTLTNNSGGTLNLGPTIGLGSSGSLANAGVLSPGGVGMLLTSTIEGVVTQSDSGSYAPDIDIATSPTSDQLVLESSGNRFAGTIDPNINSYDTSGSTTGSVTIITADGGTIDASSLTVTDSASIDYTLSGTGTDKLTLGYSIDTTASALGGLNTANGRAVANYLNGLLVLAADDPDAYPILAAVMLPVLNASSVTDLEGVYDAVVAKEAVQGHMSMRNANLEFHSALHSCPAISSDGAVNFNRQGDCTWMRASGGRIEQSASGGSAGFDENFWSLTLGGQREIGAGFGDGLFAGFGLSYQTSNANGGDFSSQRDLWQFGTVLKQERGASTFSASLSGGYFSNEIIRDLSLLGSGQAVGKPDGWMLSTELRASHDFDLENSWYAKPSVALILSKIWQNGYTESGAGSFGLEVNSVDQSTVVISPYLEIGRETDIFRGFVGIGASYYAFGNVTDVAMRFTGSGAELPWLTLTDEADDLFGQVTLGLDAVLDDNVTFSLNGNGIFSENSTSYGASAKLRIAF